MEKESLLGIPVQDTTLDEAVETAVRLLRGKGRPRLIHTVNANVLVLARRDALLRQAFLAADLLLPDGQGAVLGSRLFGNGTVRHKVAGPDFFEALTAQLAARGKPVTFFFLGSSSETLARIRRRLARECPAISFAGYAPPFAPAFSDGDNRRMLSAINRARPDVLWIGMTAPKQEKWAEAHKAAINAKLIITVGAAFDYYAGNIRRAPRWLMRLMGDTEFLYRFATNPRRMLARVVRSAVTYPLLLLRERLFPARRAP